MDAHYRTAEFHNRNLRRSEQCVNTVRSLQRFRRSFSPLSSDQISRRSQPLAFITYSFSGALQTVSKPMVEVIHSQWKQLLDRYNDLSSKTLVNILVCDGQRERKLLQVHFSQNRRSASMPLITSGSRKRGSARRSRSSPRDFCDKWRRQGYPEVLRANAAAALLAAVSCWCAFATATCCVV